MFRHSQQESRIFLAKTPPERLEWLQKRRTGKSLDWSEVLNVDWRQPNGPGSSLAGLENHPVVAVNWNDARAYCEWARRRLPTEAEWEKTVRGDGKDFRIFPWGSQPVAGYRLNYADRNIGFRWADHMEEDGIAFTAPVGSYQPDAGSYGKLDMAGNVWEWVSDWFDKNYYRELHLWNPSGPEEGKGRVSRGGYWVETAKFQRVTYRLMFTPAFSSTDIGFRCAITAKEKEKIILTTVAH